MVGARRIITVLLLLSLFSFSQAYDCLYDTIQDLPLDNQPIFRIYLINIADCRGCWTNPDTLRDSVVASLEGKGVLHITELDSFSQLEDALKTAPSGSIFINAHGEIVPIPGSYINADNTPRWEEWHNFIADKINDRKYIWVSVTGYPFYYVGNSKYPELGASQGRTGTYRIGPDGVLEFLDAYYPYANPPVPLDALDFWPHTTGTPLASKEGKITPAGQNISDCWGISLPLTISASRPATKEAHPNPLWVFYLDTGNSEESVGFVEFGQGYFVHVGTSPHQAVAGKITALAALELAAIQLQANLVTLAVESMSVSEPDNPEGYHVGESIDITATIQNTGGNDAGYTKINLGENNLVVDSVTITLDAGASEVITFTYRIQSTTETIFVELIHGWDDDRSDNKSVSAITTPLAAAPGLNFLEGLIPVIFCFVLVFLFFRRRL